MTFDKSRYPKSWNKISLSIREHAGWTCEWCGAAHGHPNPRTGSKVILTVAHLGTPYSNGQGASKADKMDVRGCNLAALCQLCHLAYDRNEHKYNRNKRKKAKQLTFFPSDENKIREEARAISIWQPWASLLASGEKQWETRSWHTSYRGPIVICSTKSWKNKALAESSPFYETLARKNLTPDTLPLGKAVGIGYLVECKPVQNVVGWLSERERIFGNYGHSRYAWRIGGARLIDSVPVKGQQGWFKLPLEQSRAVWRQIQ
jgi:hypothetical protein